MVLAHILPFLAAVDALLEVSHAFLNIATQHVILVDFMPASLDDLVTDLGQETLHPLH